MAARAESTEGEEEEEPEADGGEEADDTEDMMDQFEWSRIGSFSDSCDVLLFVCFCLSLLCLSVFVVLLLEVLNSNSTRWKRETNTRKEKRTEKRGNKKRKKEAHED